jgi:ergothioneine biosynthesis protein EgtB
MRYRFCYDNETPCHPVHIPAFELSNRLVTNAEFLEFIQDGGYDNAQWWLSDGWEERKQNPKKMPYYWYQRDEQIWEYHLRGSSPLILNLPVSHITFYEADAFARWKGCRLSTEFELEHAASQVPSQNDKSNFMESAFLQAAPASSTTELSQLAGDLWEWTSSDYCAYPGYKAWMGSLGEYNGKFMCNQKVLRGGSCITPSRHFRPTYRNFFYPNKFWPFTGIRLAKDLN